MSLLILVFSSWVFYSGTPFVSIIFVTGMSAILGFFLLVLDLGFAGMVLIIVNAGAIAVVFLFVCILAKRDTNVNRSLKMFYILPSGVLFFAFLNNLQTTVLSFLFSTVLDEHCQSASFSAPVRESLRIGDLSVLSHTALTIFSPQ